MRVFLVHDVLSVQFAALADPTRRDVLVRLSAGGASVAELSEHYAMSRPAVSQHVTVLERAGLVQRIRRGKRIDCELTAHALDPAAEWLDALRSEWTDRLDRLERHLQTHHVREEPADGKASR